VLLLPAQRSDELQRSPLSCTICESASFAGACTLHQATQITGAAQNKSLHYQGRYVPLFELGAMNAAQNCVPFQEHDLLGLLVKVKVVLSLI
jgi:hypothetical protein